MGQVLVRFLIADSSVELVPRELWEHPDVRRMGKRYGVPPSHMLLEKSLHYRAMERLPVKWKRGRPDILHVVLLNILDSPLSSRGMLEIYVHTIEGRIFWVDPRTRIPVSYERFRGLFSQLLRLGRVPPRGSPLIREVNSSLEELVSGHPVILLWEKGEKYKLSDFARALINDYPGAFVIIGGFPRGDYSRSVLMLPHTLRVSLFEGSPVKAWTVVSRILCSIEELLGY